MTIKLENGTLIIENKNSTTYCSVEQCRQYGHWLMDEKEIEKERKYYDDESMYDCWNRTACSRLKHAYEAYEKGQEDKTNNVYDANYGIIETSYGVYKERHEWYDKSYNNLVKKEEIVDLMPFYEFKEEKPFTWWDAIKERGSMEKLNEFIDFINLQHEFQKVAEDREKIFENIPWEDRASCESGCCFSHRKANINFMGKNCKVMEHNSAGSFISKISIQDENGKVILYPFSQENHKRYFEVENLYARNACRKVTYYRNKEDKITKYGFSIKKMKEDQIAFEKQYKEYFEKRKNGNTN